jgi:hypothetical protein
MNVSIGLCAVDDKTNEEETRITELQYKGVWEENTEIST